MNGTQSECEALACWGTCSQKCRGAHFCAMSRLSDLLVAQERSPKRAPCVGQNQVFDEANALSGRWLR